MEIKTGMTLNLSVAFGSSSIIQGKTNNTNQHQMY